jgi:hypothetical protein
MCTVEVRLQLAIISTGVEKSAHTKARSEWTSFSIHLKSKERIYTDRTNYELSTRLLCVQCGRGVGVVWEGEGARGKEKGTMDNVQEARGKRREARGKHG